MDGFWEEARRATQLTCGVGVSKVCLPGIATAQQAAVSFTLCQNGAFLCRVNASALPHRHAGLHKHARARGAAGGSAGLAVSLEDIFRVEEGTTWNTAGGAVLNLHCLRPALVLRQQVCCSASVRVLLSSALLRVRK